jgi:hypothetical protein
LEGTLLLLPAHDEQHFILLQGCQLLLQRAGGDRSPRKPSMPTFNCNLYGSTLVLGINVRHHQASCHIILQLSDCQGSVRSPLSSFVWEKVSQVCNQLLLGRLMLRIHPAASLLQPTQSLRRASISAYIRFIDV